MSTTFEKYPGQDILISYLKKQSNRSYYGFLNLHRDVIIDSLTLDLYYDDLNNAWISNYIREVENTFSDQEIVKALKNKINLECSNYKKELQIYWQKIIKEYHEKENLIPKTKSYLKPPPTIKIPTNDLSETSQLQKKKLNMINNDNDTDNLPIGKS
ncbi:hypothetical protein RclHR1_03390001 [Rhizophagus clarus]|uniref:Uncharacterized protein n=1 Tax=Rhizophagus clarus TaxID=94130 RepID=A0A2Z6R9J6_9GLOM|nr:hypothetical protein RclHR1_03390001 [Rhizophagus clarus]GES85172.1 hypothetical protein GLOIN_2v1790294 [Rhizophagus clarus]